jgi:hypothetical protein
MSKFAIELPDTYGVASRGAGIEINLAKLSTVMITKLALHGLTQKVADSAAPALAKAGYGGLKFKEISADDQAKVLEIVKSAMTATADTLYAGEWKEQRSNGTAITPYEAKLRIVFGAWLRANEAQVWHEHFKPLPAAERGEALEEFFAAQGDELHDLIDGSVKEQLAQDEKNKAELAKGKIAVKLVMPAKKK